MPELPPPPDPLADVTSFESTAFRESMLLHIDDPGDRDALRRAGCFLYNLILESSRRPYYQLTSTQAELRAAQADMVYLRSFLAAIGHGLEASSLPPAPLLQVDDRQLQRHQRHLIHALPCRVGRPQHLESRSGLVPMPQTAGDAGLQPGESQ